MENLPRLIIFSSGTKEGGGSGFEKLVSAIGKGVLQADIIAVVSNHEYGGVRERADRLGIPFEFFSKPYTSLSYFTILKKYNTQWIALSGWLKLIPMKNEKERKEGLDPSRTINIHPGPLPAFGGSGMYGHYVHSAVMDAYNRGEIIESAVTMHFVTHKYDKGPVIFRKLVPIEENDTPEILGARVNKVEHEYQAFVTNLVVNEQIKWDGVNSDTLVVPRNYPFLN